MAGIRRPCLYPACGDPPQELPSWRWASDHHLGGFRSHLSGTCRHGV